MCKSVTCRNALPSLCRNGNFLRLGGLLNAVGGDARAVDVDAALHTVAIHVGEVPGHRE